MNKYFNRVTASARGEAFNPLLWPFLLTTFAFGIGFAVIQPFTNAFGSSSLYTSLVLVHSAFPLIWGIFAITTIVLGLTFLLFNKPPYGKASGLMGFSLWALASGCYMITGEWLVLFAFGVPNMWFWFWQYLSLSHFRGEESEDKSTMESYDAGEYDDQENPKDSKIARDNNRGADRQ